MAHDVKLGTILDEPQQRDAIHIAVAPVLAAVKLAPGQDIGFVDGDKCRVGISDQPIGIVDPFLNGLVFPGQRFWMFLYPQTITSLRHDWTHPAFVGPEPVVVDKAASEAWLQAFAVQADLSYREVMDAAEGFLLTGDYLTQYDQESARDAIYSVGPREFWKHYEIVTGKPVPEDDKDGSIFSCSC